MSVLSAVGWLAALCSASIAVPQGFRFFRSRSSAGVSLLIWQTTLVASLSWTAHGLVVGVVQIAVPNGILAATSAIVLTQLQRLRGLGSAGVWVLPVVWAAAAAIADVGLGSVVFAVVVFIPTALGLLSQWREIRVAQDVAGVSVPGVALNLVCQSLWLIYAVPSGEIAVICVATPVIVLIVGTLVTLLARRRELDRALLPA